MVVMTSDGPSPHSPSLRLGLPAPQPPRRHHAQSLLGPSFHDPGTHHVLKSHPERAAPLSRRDNERWHAIGSHSALALRLYLAAYITSSSCCFWVLDHLCSNLSQSFDLCWITEIRSLNLCPKWVVFRQNIIHNPDMQSPLSPLPVPPSLTSLLPSLPPFFLPLRKTPRKTKNKFFVCVWPFPQFLGSIRNIQSFWYLCCAFCV